MAIPDNSNAPEGSDRAVESRSSGLKSSRRGTFRWTVGLLVRLCIWYALITPFLRCPSQLSDLTDTSPRVCKPYLVARSYIEPHVTPYYNAYGAPYVETARPYVLVLNEKVYAPTSRVFKRGYERYGAPALDRAHLYGQQQWEINVVPHLQSATDSVNGLYQSQIQPHVKRVEAALSPSLQRVNGAVKSAYGDYLLPFGAKYRPFIGKIYTSGQDMLTTTVLPYAQNSWSTAIYFIHSSLWPRVTGLYWENVEPQLIKIGERLASYREVKRLRQAVEEVETVSEQPSSSPSSPKATEAKDLTSSSTTEEIIMQQTLSPTEQAAKARDSIESDLRTWQQKFAVAAEKGLEDLEERLQEIVDMFMASETRTQGESLTTALEAVVDNEMIALKHHINNLAESLPVEDAPQEEEAAKDELLGNVKEAAVSIRDRAHALREWRGSFERELTYRVSRAINSTLDVLDSVRDLGLQEVGMRWAWMDGVTYKDWARYHALKAQFEDWKDEFLDFGLQHVKLEEARAAADEILSHGMEIAEAAAKELGRLRNVGNWKITAREVSDNFDTRSDLPPPRPKPIPAPEETVGGDAATDGVADNELPENEPTFVFDSTSQIENNGVDGDDESMAGDEEHASPQPGGERSPGYTPTTLGSDSENDIAVTHNTDDTSDLKKTPWGVAAADVTDQNMPDTHRTPGHVPSESDNLGVSGHDLSSEQEAVASLISGLLVGKDAAYAEDIMNKLHSIYGIPRPTPEASVVSDRVPREDSIDADASSASIPVSEDQFSPSLHETDGADDALGTAGFVPSVADDEQSPNSGIDVEVDSAMDSAESHSATLGSTTSSLVSEAAETVFPESTQPVEDNAEL
ncbi:hypothetical protein BO94DRAFT_532982 [Aspergillus sclerotioniger CBS 115572]|uniref:Transcription factor hoxa13 n=1 Tax=Aspergillus sclerotioniger CBS 115572 TaxID=1450535 RepID=A0A317X3W7_9EURO|nr:hypothetical protein BO94DRAFT_532982 [Aspergillus sclerotioniger CBS 115572]PWY93256.1 hypothetical protein BO94DRAFT_532982 [Aspergillus sclerotioniger CBS 115572]